jgi:hypothetical protein
VSYGTRVTRCESGAVCRAHVDRALASRVAGIGLFVKADFLALAQLLKLDVYDGRAVEEDIVASFSTRGNEAKALVVANSDDSTCSHGCPTSFLVLAFLRGAVLALPGAAIFEAYHDANAYGIPDSDQWESRSSRSYAATVS